MFRMIRKWREERRWVVKIAHDLVAAHGKGARVLIIRRLVERGRANHDTALECKVKREIDRHLGIADHVDTATRYLEDRR